VAPLFRFKTDAEAIRMANDTSSASPLISTARTSAASGVAEALEYGIVGIKEGIISTRSPFGGVKESGIGREGSNTHRGVLEVKYLCMGGATNRSFRLRI